MKKRLLSLLLAGTLLCPVLAGCNDVAQNPSDTTGRETESEELQDTAGKITAAQLANYTVVRSALADKSVTNAANAFVTALNSAYGLSKELNRDHEETECEILIGEADRKETQSFLADLRAGDWGYGMVGTKLIIAGKSDEGTLAALTAFTEAYLQSAADVFFDSANAYTYLAEYSLKTVTVNGKDLKDYTIVCPETSTKGEDEAALLLRNTVLESYGYALPVVKDSRFSGGNAIYIGAVSQITAEMQTERNTALPADSSERAYYMAGSDGVLWLDANLKRGISESVKGLGATMLGATDGVCTLTVGAGEATSFLKTSVSSMSFNISYKFVNGDATQMARAERVITLIKNYDPDTIGFQEANPDWMEYLSEQLGATYGYVGEARMGNGKSNDEANPVFYKKEKFTLVKSGTYWLSLQPTVQGSLYQGASLPRVLTYAVLQDKTTGEKIMHLNTHLADTPKAARLGQLGIVCKLVENVLPQNIPFVLTGDFNQTAKDGVLASTLAEIGCVNSTEIMESGDASAATFPGGKNVIDYLWATEETIGVKSYKVCDEKINDGTVSDHNPLFVEWYTVK